MDRLPSEWDQAPSADRPWPIIESCSEACAGFKRLPQEGWSEYGLCTNPLSPLHGSPVLVGRDCRYAIHLISPRET
jgi:hypothetical protein